MPTKLGKGGAGEQPFNANTGKYTDSGATSGKFTKDGNFSYEVIKHNDGTISYHYGKEKSFFGITDLEGEFGKTLEEARNNYLKIHEKIQKENTIKKALEEKYKDVIKSVEKYSEEKSNGFIDYSSKGGYSGYSMSNRAKEAYASGEKPLSSWRKEDILEELGNVEELEPLMEEFKKMSLTELKDKFLTNSSYHHTSKFFNTTNFYSLKKPNVIVDNFIDSKIEKTNQKQFTNFGKT